MKNLFWPIFGFCVFILLCAMVGAIFLASNKIRQLQSVITEQNDSIHYHKNESGRILGEKHAAELRSKELAAAYPEIAKTIERDFDVKLKNLKAYIQNEFQARGSGQGQVVNNHYYDSASKRTIRFKDFSMDDKYLIFKTRLYDSLSSSLYHYVYRDTSTTVVHQQKKWILGKEELYATTMFSNPNAKITGTTNILINNYRDKRWVVSVGVYGDPIMMRYGIGMHVGYALIKF